MLVSCQLQFRSADQVIDKEKLGSHWDRFDLKTRLRILHYVLPAEISIVPTKIPAAFASSMPRDRRDDLRTHRHWGWDADFSRLLLVSKFFFEDVKVAFYNRAVFEVHFYEQGVQFLDFDRISSYEGIGYDWAARLKSRFSLPYSVFQKKSIRHLKFVFWACDFDSNPLAGLRMRTNAFQIAKSFDGQVLHSLQVVFEENMEIECHCCGAMKLYWCGSLEHMCPDGTQHPGDYCSHIHPTALHETVLAMDRSTIETVSAPLQRLRVSTAELILPPFNDSVYDQGYAAHFQGAVCSQNPHDRKNDGYENLTTNDWDEYKAMGPMTAPRYSDRQAFSDGVANHLAEFPVPYDDAAVFADLAEQEGMDFFFTMESSMGDAGSSRGNDMDNIAGPLTYAQDEWPGPEMFDDLYGVAHPNGMGNIGSMNQNEAPGEYTLNIVDTIADTYEPSADLPLPSISEQQLLDALFENSAHIHPMNRVAAVQHDLVVLGDNPNIAATSDDGHDSDLSIISANTESPELVALSDGDNNSISPMDIDMTSDQDEPEMLDMSEDEEQAYLVDLNDHIKRAEQVQQTQTNASGASGSKHKQKMAASEAKNGGR